jgi:multisubunit Na+/H+ antiporter MnhC subunit
MNMNLILAVIAIVFGILVIAFKDLLNWIVGIAFILVGIYFLIDYMNRSNKQTSPQTKDAKK